MNGRRMVAAACVVVFVANGCETQENLMAYKVIFYIIAPMLRKAFSAVPVFFCAAAFSRGVFRSYGWTYRTFGKVGGDSFLLCELLAVLCSSFLFFILLDVL